MESHQVDSSSSPIVAAPDIQHSATQHDIPTGGKSSILSASGISSWARSLKKLQQSGQGDPQSGNAVMSTFTRFTGGLGSRLSNKSSAQDENADNPTNAQSGSVVSLTKGLVDSSLNAVKAVQVKARHVVSQNKRRYQEDGFDLDMTYITDNIIAMGFPGGDMSSGFLGYVEGFYRNHMEEVIKFFETHHKDKYKVYNLCSERLYNASLFQGKVAFFPFDDHNCPPIHVILSFCQNASSWLKEDEGNVVAVHCKAGLGRTGLMICSLLVFLKFFLSAEEAINHFNEKRCIDRKGIVIPSQIRYVKYFERILTYFNGEVQQSRRCTLKGFRLINCPYWIRPSITISDHTGILFSTKRHPKTKDLMPEDFWFSSKKKGIMIFALPGHPGLAELDGDFKIHFSDRQGDFFCWLNTTMIENRTTLNGSELDDFDKRKIPAPGFQLEIVMVDSDGYHAKGPVSADKESDEKPVISKPSPNSTQDAGSHDKDDVFSDNESEGTESSKSKHAQTASSAKVSSIEKESEIKTLKEETKAIGDGIGRVSLRSEGVTKNADGDIKSTLLMESSIVSEFKPVTADASVFSFGDDDDYESE
ncbi:uncharacterized protein A4U43_C07F8570 [Asparagus officinalis]|uniref:Phosphatidylinositol-3,4,5-trisphosphate 3-phosphatase n=1 Tax=Asparagus officinalis TaxID=4686 RepID=A0A5P1EFI2_ASPOF|nr:phosphatidylinositol 3,4,5-trisphosphate 3-phosphatase and protein-tyrosine-phosphatase PTEN2A-like [Asparagus officinalis]ONK62830.1 uncharacterized protein A4U43_C07F8570 [Asparagus officinalis]